MVRYDTDIRDGTLHLKTNDESVVVGPMDDIAQNEAAEMYGFSEGWASKWFSRLERLETEPFEAVVYDEPRSGRPSELSEREKQQFTEVVYEPPGDVGIDAPAWSVPLARNYLNEAFDVEYSDRHVGDYCARPGCPGRQPGRSSTNQMNEHRKRGRKGSKKVQQPGRRIHDRHNRPDTTGPLEADQRVVSQR